MSTPSLLIGWTTVASREVAETLAKTVVERGDALCVQIDGPVASFYRWHGKLDQAEEYRLTIKFLPQQQTSLEQGLLAAHPYDTPEWVVTPCVHVGEKYLSWARASLQSDRF